MLKEINKKIFLITILLFGTSFKDLIDHLIKQFTERKDIKKNLKIYRLKDLQLELKK